LADDPQYLKAIAPGWRPWHEHTLAFLKDADLTRPILVPGPDHKTLEEDLRNPYLLQLQAQGVIARAITKALEPGADINHILDEAQQSASLLVDRSISPSKGR
jgi:hypothetical protein